jgi:16S rRNA processing protein RimM
MKSQIPVQDEPIPAETDGQGLGGSEGRKASEPPRYLAVARIRRPWGVRGFVKIDVWTDFPERFRRPGRFFVGEDYRPIWLEHGRIFKGQWLLKFAGYDTPESSGELRNQILYISVEDAVPLGEDEYYIHEIIGLEVWTDTGERLGRVTEVIETGANDVYVVDWQGKPLLLPAISQVILSIDRQARRMVVHLMEGLVP